MFWNSNLTLDILNKAIRRACSAPDLIICHPDHMDDIRKRIDVCGWTRLGIEVKSSEFLDDKEAVYFITT